MSDVIGLAPVTGNVGLLPVAGKAGLLPVAGKARIDVLDILRGIAILGIFYMNIPYMGSAGWMITNDIRSIGWSVADRNTWAVIAVIWEGTQRGVLEFLFGAGMMVLTARAMTPDGPVAIADLYFRRNLWLLLFGLFDIFVLLWAGDILHVYALAALFLFPFRKLGPKTLLALGLLFATTIAVLSSVEYVARTELVQTVERARASNAAGQALSVGDKQAVAEWRKKLDRIKLDDKEKKRVADEEKSHRGGLLAYAMFNWNVWLTFAGEGSIYTGVAEAFSTMLIGIALWKWRIIQGGRSARFYCVLMLASYGFGCTARGVGVAEVFTFLPVPKTIWINAEYARLAVSLGHVALVNLIVKSALGAKLLSPFKAAGKTAFSLYFLEQIIGMFVLFSPFGVGLWGRYSWAGLAAIATGVVVFNLIVANIWVRYFTNGPLEWLWRSLAYVERQPFRKRVPGEPVY